MISNMRLSFAEFFSEVNSAIMNLGHHAGMSRVGSVSVLVIFQLRSILHPSQGAFGGDSSGVTLALRSPTELLLEAPAEDQRVEREGSWGGWGT